MLASHGSVASPGLEREDISSILIAIPGLKREDTSVLTPIALLKSDDTSSVLTPILGLEREHFFSFLYCLLKAVSSMYFATYSEGVEPQHRVRVGVSYGSCFFSPQVELKKKKKM